jgi:hypothetical protein
MKKTRSKKSRDTVPLRNTFREMHTVEILQLTALILYPPWRKLRELFCKWWQFGALWPNSLPTASDHFPFLYNDKKKLQSSRYKVSHLNCSEAIGFRDFVWPKIGLTEYVYTKRIL